MAHGLGNKNVMSSTARWKWDPQVSRGPVTLARKGFGLQVILTSARQQFKLTIAQTALVKTVGSIYFHMDTDKKEVLILLDHNSTLK